MREKCASCPKAGNTDKTTIDLRYVGLGHIDLTVREAFYSNWTDFIRTAIRNQLDRHADEGGRPDLWGTVAFLQNYVPILGTALGMVIFLLAGLLTIDTLRLAMLAAGLYIGNSFDRRRHPPLA